MKVHETEESFIDFTAHTIKISQPLKELEQFRLKFQINFWIWMKKVNETRVGWIHFINYCALENSS